MTTRKNAKAKTPARAHGSGKATAPKHAASSAKPSPKPERHPAKESSAPGQARDPEDRDTPAATGEKPRKGVASSPPVLPTAPPPGSTVRSRLIRQRHELMKREIDQIREDLEAETEE